MWFLVLMLVGCMSAPSDDMIGSVPGYDDDLNPPRVFAGYLPTESEHGQLHYIFVESVKGGDNNQPVTLWINGLACSSKLGFLMELAPNFLPTNHPYHTGDILTHNIYSWHLASNLIFIDLPAGVGYSINDDEKYVFDDVNTASDTLYALLHLFKEKFSEYHNNNFYIAGESYAGKFIPDLALRINAHNKKDEEGKINLKGILMGNPIFDGDEEEMEKMQVDMMMQRNFIDPKLQEIWTTSCDSDEESARCQFFLQKYEHLMSGLNFANIYGTCYQAEQSKFAHAMVKKLPPEAIENTCNNYQEGLNDYFKINYKTFNSLKSTFQACNSTIFAKYERSEWGSLNQIPSILEQTDIRVHVYSGDWDSIVSVSNTMKCFEKMSFKQTNKEPWKINDQHVGFRKTYSYGSKQVHYWIVKGAGHEAPMYQRESTFQMFKAFLLNS